MSNPFQNVLYTLETLCKFERTIENALAYTFLFSPRASRAQVFGASAIAGFFASFFSLPFDYVKTQMQKQKPDPVSG